jgi:AraC family transcriptional regulator
MPDRNGLGVVPPLSARIRGGKATFRAEGSWGGGRIYGAIKRWRGADAELSHQRPQHTVILTLGGGTDLTGTRISGSPMYEGRDGAGCLTFVPGGSERLGWYRNADMNFVVLLIDPDFVRICEFGAGAGDLQPFTNRRDALLEGVLWSLSNEMQDTATALPSLYAEHAAGLLMSHLTRSTQRGRLRQPSRGGLSDAGMRRVVEFVEENLHRDITLCDLAALVHMGPDVFSRGFKRRLGIPPHRYLTERRMRHARLLLAAKEHSIAEIALIVGFSSQSHFTTRFGRLFNVTPGAFRALHQL